MKQAAMRLATGDNSKAIARKIRFTVASLELMNPPKGKDRVWCYDEKTPGLAFMATVGGSKSFYLYRKINGRPKRMRLGGFPGISIEQARNLAAKLNGEIAGGADPHEERKQVRASSTLQSLWDRYQADRSSVRFRKATIISDASRFTTCFGDWASRPIAGITPADVRDKHAALGKSRGHTTGNRAVQLLRRLYNFARFKPNPAASGEVEFFSETARERFLQPEEVERFLKAVDGYNSTVGKSYSDTVRDFVYMALWTGARRGNVQAMRWDDISLERLAWTVPADQSKKGKPMTIHLTAQAVGILNRRANNGSPFVFPGRRGNGHLIDPKAGWKTILQTAGIRDFHIHDLRRTLGSWMVASGASLPLIGKQLGHANVATTAIYSRLNIDPARSFVDMATAALAKAGASKIK